MTKPVAQNQNSKPVSLPYAIKSGDVTTIAKVTSKLTVGGILRRSQAQSDQSHSIKRYMTSYCWWLDNKGADGRKQAMAEIMESINDLARQIDSGDEQLNLWQHVQQDEADILDTIELLLLQVMQFFMVDKIMDKDASRSLAARICATHGGFTVDDVALCLNKAMNGDYGKLYGNKLDGGVVMAWISEYQKERQAELIRQQKELHAQSKSGTGSTTRSSSRISDPKRFRDL